MWWRRSRIRPAGSTSPPATLDERILDYAEALTATFADDLSRVALCCSGTEASELALRIARACTGNEGVIVTDFCYHGNSAVVASLCTAFDAPEGRDPRVRTIHVPDGPGGRRRRGCSRCRGRHCLDGGGRHPARRDLLRHDLRDRRHAGCACGLRREGRRAHPRRRRALHRGTRCSRASAALARRCGGTSCTTRCPTW